MHISMNHTSGRGIISLLTLSQTEYNRIGVFGEGEKKKQDLEINSWNGIK